MKSYRVRWEIDIEADSPEEAAQEALAIQRDEDSIATVFNVIDSTGHGKAYTIDFLTGDITSEGAGWTQ